MDKILTILKVLKIWILTSRILKSSERHFSRLVMIGVVQPMDHASSMMHIEWQVKLGPARSGI